MDKKFKYIFCIVLTAFFVISIMPTVFAATWVIYDDGDADVGWSRDTGDLLAVRFSLPSGWTSAKILTARIWIYSEWDNDFKLHILASDQSTDLLVPIPTISPSGTGWLDVDVSSSSIVVTGDFYIAVEFLTDDVPYIGVDDEAPYYSRTLDRIGGVWTTYGDRDNLIRAELQQPEPTSPVGGDVFTVDKLALLTPYIMIVVLMTAAILIKKRLR